MFEVWGRIVGVLFVLIVITFLVQWILPRGKSKQAERRQYLRRDVAPMLGFFGILILGLSFAESIRRDVIVAWSVGIALGMLVGVVVGMLWNYRKNQPAAPHDLWYYMRRFGAPVILGIIGLYLAVRVFGVGLEVFVAGTLGITVIAIALLIFKQSSVPSRQ